MSAVTVTRNDNFVLFMARGIPAGHANIEVLLSALTAAGVTDELSSRQDITDVVVCVSTAQKSVARKALAQAIKGFTGVELEPDKPVSRIVIGFGEGSEASRGITLRMLRRLSSRRMPAFIVTVQGSTYVAVVDAKIAGRAERELKQEFGVFDQ